MYGFGFPNQGFYCLKIPGAAKQMSTENVGLIQIRSGEASTERLEDELKSPLVLVICLFLSLEMENQ